MNVKSKQPAQVIDHPSKESTPADYAISIHMQNMFATYGEAKVITALQDLFGMNWTMPTTEDQEEQHESSGT